MALAPEHVNPESIRTAYPSAWPQYPYNEAPPTPEQSEVSYSIHSELARRLRVRDGVELAYDVFRRARNFPPCCHGRPIRASSRGPSLPSVRTRRA